MGIKVRKHRFGSYLLLIIKTMGVDVVVVGQEKRGEAGKES